MVTFGPVPNSPGAISKMSRPIWFSIAERIGEARKPAASVPARTISSCSCADDSWLVEVLNRINDRMSDWSSGGVLARRSSGSCIGPKMLTRVSTPEMTRCTVT